MQKLAASKLEQRIQELCFEKRLLVTAIDVYVYVYVVFISRDTRHNSLRQGKHIMCCKTNSEQKME